MRRGTALSAQQGEEWNSPVATRLKCFGRSLMRSTTGRSSNRLRAWPQTRLPTPYPERESHVRERRCSGGLRGSGNPSRILATSPSRTVR